MSRIEVLKSYRHLIRTIRLLPKQQDVTSGIIEVQKRFRDNKNESDPETVKELLKYANGRLGFLQTQANVSPYQREHRNRVRVVAINNTLKENVTIEKERAYFKENNPFDIEHIKKHKQLTERQRKLGF